MKENDVQVVEKVNDVVVCPGMSTKQKVAIIAASVVTCGAAVFVIKKIRDKKKAKAPVEDKNTETEVTE